MSSKPKKYIINIDNNKYADWELYLKNEFANIRSNNIEINCNNLDLTCKDLLEIIKITNRYNCKIIGFCSTSTKTIVSSQSLGFQSQFINENHSNKNSSLTKENSDFSKTNFHQGTIRSGEYLESPGDLLILGDVNPGAVVRAEGNITIWGRLLGIAHAGCKGNAKAKIAALHLRPVQLRIANLIARGPQEKPQIGLAEQAKIVSEKIIITPLANI